MDEQMLSHDRDWGVLAASEVRRIAQVNLTRSSACQERITLKKGSNPLISLGSILE